MKKLSKLSISPEKIMKNEELINLQGGYDILCECYDHTYGVSMGSGLCGGHTCCIDCGFALTAFYSRDIECW